MMAGLLCMAAALAVFLHNRFESQHAQTESAKIVAELSEQISAESEAQSETFPTDNPDRSMPRFPSWIWSFPFSLRLITTRCR